MDYKSKINDFNDVHNVHLVKYILYTRLKGYEMVKN